MISSNKIGLVIGAVLAGWHALWALLVLAGWAQPLIDFVLWAHMIKPVYVVKPFDPAAAGVLLVIAATTGYLFGLAGAMVWNKLHRPRL